MGEKRILYSNFMNLSLILINHFPFRAFREISLLFPIFTVNNL